VEERSRLGNEKNMVSAEVSRRTEGGMRERAHLFLLSFDDGLGGLRGVIPDSFVPVSTDGTDLDSFRGGHNIALT